MKILIIPSWYPTPSSPLNGIFIKEQVAALAKSFPQHSFTVYYISEFLKKDSFSKPFVTIKQKISKNNLTEIACRKNMLLFKILNKLKLAITAKHRFFAKIILNDLKNEEFDLIHAHVSFPGGHLAMLLASKLKIPYVITEHMGPFPFPQFPYSSQQNISIYLRNALGNASQIIAVSHSLAKKIASYNLPTPIVIPNMVNQDIFKYHPLEITPRPFKFFSLAILSPQKGFDTLLSAFSLILQQVDAKLLIGGDGTILAPLQEMASNLKITENVIWLGALDRTQSYSQFQNCNCFVLPSRHESFGIVYAEALACGKPIIATKCGGPEDIVKNINGLLCEIDNPQSLADTMLTMIKNYDQYDSQQIYLDFVNNFSAKVVTSQIEKLYTNVLQQS